MTLGRVKPSVNYRKKKSKYSKSINKPRYELFFQDQDDGDSLNLLLLFYFLLVDGIQNDLDRI